MSTKRGEKAEIIASINKALEAGGLIPMPLSVLCALSLVDLHHLRHEWVAPVVGRLMGARSKPRSGQTADGIRPAVNRKTDTHSNPAGAVTYAPQSYPGLTAVERTFAEGLDMETCRLCGALVTWIPGVLTIPDPPVPLCRKCQETIDRKSP